MEQNDEKPTDLHTRRDMQRLRNLLDDPDLMQQKPYLEQLQRELDRAVVVSSIEIPTDTITMDSTALLIDLETGEEMILTLVYPDQAYIPEGRISVLAPVGTAILGCRQGDTVEWEVPAAPGHCESIVFSINRKQQGITCYEYGVLLVQTFVIFVLKFKSNLWGVLEFSDLYAPQ